MIQLPKERLRKKLKVKLRLRCESELIQYKIKNRDLQLQLPVLFYMETYSLGISLIFSNFANPTGKNIY
jgi:hypothetical protein